MCKNNDTVFNLSSQHKILSWSFQECPSESSIVPSFNLNTYPFFKIENGCITVSPIRVSSCSHFLKNFVQSDQSLKSPLYNLRDICSGPKKNLSSHSGFHCKTAGLKTEERNHFFFLLQIVSALTVCVWIYLELKRKESFSLLLCIWGKKMASSQNKWF